MSRRTRQYKHSVLEVIIPLLVLASLVPFLPKEKLQQVGTILGVGIVIALPILVFVIWWVVTRRRTRLARLQGVQDIRNMNGWEFEKYLMELLRFKGFTKLERTPNQSDFGADILGTFKGIRYAIQAKRYNRLVGVEALYQCFGGQRYYGCEQSMVITTAQYTDSALELGRKSKAWLVEGNELEKWIEDFRRKR